MKSGIYKITNINNGKVYIGRASNIEKRWQEHKDLLAAGAHHSYKLQECYNSLENKHDLKYEIIEEVAYENERVVKEQYYIDKYDAYHNGYNCCEFADNPKYITPQKEDIKNFVFYASWVSVIEAFDEMDQSDMAGELAKQIVYYGTRGKFATDNPIIKGIVEGMCTDLIDKSKSRYVHSIENGKKGGRPPKYDKNKMLELRSSGFSDQEIAGNLGCNVKTVQRTLADVSNVDEDEI